MVTTAAIGRAGSCAAHAFGLPTLWAAFAGACVTFVVLSALLWPVWSLAQTSPSNDEMTVLKANAGTLAASASSSSPIAPPSATVGAVGRKEQEGGNWVLMLIGVVFLVVIVLAMVVMIYARRDRRPHTSLTIRDDGDGAKDGVSRRPEALLIDRVGTTELGEISINEDVVILGRSKQNSSAGVQGVVLPIGTVGRRHACVEYRLHAFYVSDLASVNGTFVNGNRVHEPTILHNGDIVRIESLELTFALPMEGQGEETQFVRDRGVDDAMANMQSTLAAPVDAPDAPVSEPVTPTPPAAPAKPGSMMAQFSAEVEVEEAPDLSTEVFAEPLIDVSAEPASITVAPGFEAAAEAGAAKSAQEAPKDEDPDVTLTEPMPSESISAVAPGERVTPPQSASDTHDSLIASLLADDEEEDEDRTAGDAVTGIPPGGVSISPPLASAASDATPAAPAEAPGVAPESPSTPEFAPSNDAPTVMPRASLPPARAEASVEPIAPANVNEVPTSAFPDSALQAPSAEGGTDFPLLVDSAETAPPVGDARAFAETTVSDEDTQDPHEADTSDSIPRPHLPEPATGTEDAVDNLLRKVEQPVPTPVLAPDHLQGQMPERANLEREGVVAPSNLPPVMPPTAPGPPPRAPEPPPPGVPKPAPQPPTPKAEPPRRSAPAEMPPAFLVDLDGPIQDQQYQIELDSVVVGRSKATPENAKTYLSIRRNTVGRKHATVRYARGLFWVEDHKSVNGTFVNGERVDGMSPLVSGDEVTFDTYRFRFVVMEEDDTDASLDPLDLDKTQFRGA